MFSLRRISSVAFWPSAKVARRCVRRLVDWPLHAPERTNCAGSNHHTTIIRVRQPVEAVYNNIIIFYFPFFLLFIILSTRSAWNGCDGRGAACILCTVHTYYWFSYLTESYYGSEPVIQRVVFMCVYDYNIIIMTCVYTSTLPLSPLPNDPSVYDWMIMT